MWQFFTERGKRIIQIAHHEALKMGHSMVEPEHLLLGLAQEGGGVASRALAELGVDAGELCARIREIMGRGEPSQRPVDLPLSPRLRKALEAAILESRKMGVNYVDTEHILLGILADEGSLTFQHFLTLGITPDAVRQQVAAIVETGGARQNRGPGGAAAAQKRKGRSGTGTVKTPTLDQLGDDLTQRAKDGELDPVIGRDREIRRVMQVLCRRTKSNPVLVG
ncbi:MAG: ATP-dependent Clp protease ATP-binding subunit, partial [Synergistaceae bacterium]|nr:ATP-dependent Clp protease ATP-binding subunit [Synergistaceae bacterium]